VRIRVLESAKKDLQSAWYFYENQSPGLGDYCLDSLQADIRSLTVYAGMHTRVDGVFRMLGKRFPFAMYYSMDEESIDILAVLDCRRDPQWIAKRLK